MSTRNLSWSAGRCVGLTILPASCADCLEILRPSTSWRSDSFTFTFISVLGRTCLWKPQDSWKRLAQVCLKADRSIYVGCTFVTFIVLCHTLIQVILVVYKYYIATVESWKLVSIIHQLLFIKVKQIYNWNWALICFVFRRASNLLCFPIPFTRVTCVCFCHSFSAGCKIVSVCWYFYNIGFEFVLFGAKLRKTTISFMISVRLSACNNSASTGRILIKLVLWVFSTKICLENSSFIKIRCDYSFFTWRRFRIYDNVSLNSS